MKNIDNDTALTALYDDAQSTLRSFAGSSAAEAAAAAAFGASVGAADVRAVLAVFDASGWPRLVLLDEQTLNGARGAYERATDTVYLSRQYAAQADSAAVTAVLLEELGHAIDGRVNSTDAPGDEGAILANAVLGNAEGNEAPAALRAGNDGGTITIAGTARQVEFASHVAGSITLDGSLTEWSAADSIDSSLSLSGYDIQARATGGSYVFALKAPTAIGANTTVWLNTDQDSATGYKIWGFAGGAEYNINFDASGTPRLYTGADGQTLVPGASVSFGYAADRTAVEFAISASSVGSPSAINTLWDINNNTFLPSDYSSTQYAVVAAAVPPPPAATVGTITLDGNLAEWTAADQIDSSLGLSGYDIYAKATGGSYVFALKAPAAIGANTTTWLNTDQNVATGYKIWGFAGGAEYNINFDASGTPRLYSGADGQTLVSGATVSFGYSADRTAVEFGISASALGSPQAINTLWDINNNTFLPTDYSTTQYAVASVAAPAPVIGSVMLDGNLADWTAADQIDASLSTSGFDIYAKATGGSYVFALKAPAAIGANTTTWLNTDQDSATGYKIWGFAGGAEYNINFDATGTPRLYTGADGQTLVPGAAVSFGYSADRTVVEFAISASSVGSPSAINTLWDINNNTFLPSDYSSTQYAVVATAIAPPPPPPASVAGSITLDGSLADWSAAQQIDSNLSAAGYDIYARASGDYFVFALKAPTAIGASTTAWLNTDQNAATGFQIFGNAGGAEYNINFDGTGVPRLYTGDAGQTLLSPAITYGYSADGTVVEFAVAKSALGSPAVLNTLWDINNSTFLPTSFGTTQYQVFDDAALPVRTDVGTKIGIVYSETTANQYFSKTAYSQLFMAAQNQAMMAGVPFDVLTESDLTNLSKLANYDALLFPSFSNVQSSQLAAIENTLNLAIQQYDIGLITAGNFMTNSETGAALPGDAYARMKSLLGVQLVDSGFPADVSVNASDITSPVMDGYAPQELISTYTATGWLAFAPVTANGSSVLATQTVNGQTYDAVVSTTTGGRNVHFSTEAVMADNNLLGQAIDYAANGDGVTAGLQLSRQTSIVAARVDMDQAMQLADVTPGGGAPGIYDKLLPILQSWKNAYNFVGSYYVDVGSNPALEQATDWSISGQYYKQLLAMGNELGSHSVSHPNVTDQLTAAQIQAEFQGSRQTIEQQMSAVLGTPFTINGAAVPGNPESLATALAISQYYGYLSGGFSGVGAGYPSAFGYLDPAMAAQNKVYLAPNMQSDFSLVEFRGMTPAQAAAEWQREWSALANRAELPVVVWPWHDYGAAAWATNPPAASPYTTEMFTDMISRAYASGAEFVTLDDLARRISAFDGSTLTSSVTGSTITATVTSGDAGKFALDLDNLGTQQIARVSGWYAYDADSVFLPRNGGSYTIELGSASDDVTRIVSLPMRSELVSVTGNGTNLDFSLIGEGSVGVVLGNAAAQQYVVTGASAASVNGDRLELTLGVGGAQSVTIAQGSDGNDAVNSLIGSASNDLLSGGGGNDVLIGRAGQDSLTGGAGRDRFDYNALSDGRDVITDFTRGAQGDWLDIKDVLVGYNAGSSDINNFVQLLGNGGTTVMVNADGFGTDFIAMATLQNVSLTSSLLNDMLTNGNVVVS